MLNSPSCNTMDVRPVMSANRSGMPSKCGWVSQLMLCTVVCIRQIAGNADQACHMGADRGVLNLPQADYDLHISPSISHSLTLKTADVLSVGQCLECEEDQWLYLGKLWTVSHVIEVQHDEALACCGEVWQAIFLSKERPSQRHAAVPLHSMASLCH